ncbi:hypothetical protein CLV68_4506 [Actinokineospora cianjurensis]|uniref:Uncharacterized protein n=2 Tax=Actinokineospora cianjurensis TaxID=585224 RepID=A0A421B1Y7_9PSEU|nr:hypothetical protein CLV68_4506 [Actinokineospora cianjurensis]
MEHNEPIQKKPPERQLPVTVNLTPSEMSAIRRASFLVTSAGEQEFINAANRAIHKLRDAAHKHNESS